MTAKIIAFCGPDGVGKTTLLHTLEKWIDHEKVNILWRGNSAIEQLASRWLPKKYCDFRDWLSGDFAEGIAISCALDFSSHYEQIVAPAINKYSIGGPHFLLSDRYSTCFLAYAECLSEPSHIAIEILAKIPHPDLVILLTADWATIEQRKACRAETNPFEIQESQVRFLDAYKRVFKKFNIPYIEIDNSGEITDTVQLIRNEILKTFQNDILYTVM